MHFRRYRWFPILILCVTALSDGSGVESFAKRSARPNILLIVADDLGLQLGCYGDPLARTPNIDRFAREGVRFETAYVAQSSCSPSRSSILTGLYPHQNGQLGLANRGYAMHADVATLPALLKQAGYRTGIIGKLHVNPEEAFPFDYADKNMGAARDVRSVAKKAGAFWSEGNAEPWFLMVNYMDPHVPFVNQHLGLPEIPQNGEEMRPFSFQKVDTEDVRSRMAGYYNGVARLDAGVGFLLGRLAEVGAAESTLVIFIGDNGPPFVRAKTNCTEAGLRTPFIVRWPGSAKSGAVSSALVSTVDLVPTFLAAAGIPPLKKLDGYDLRPVLLDEKPAAFRRYLAAEYNAHRADMYFPQRTIRDSRYKLILNLHEKREFGIEVDGDPAAKVIFDPNWSGTTARRMFEQLVTPPREELYDLESDPDELNNLVGTAGAQAELKRLRLALGQWRTATADPLLNEDSRVTKADVSKVIYEH